MKVRSVAAVFAWVLIGCWLVAQSSPTVSTPSSSSRVEDPLLKVLVSKNIITKEEAAAVNSAAAPQAQRQKLTQLLVAKGVLTNEEAAGILGVKPEPVLLASANPGATAFPAAPRLPTSLPASLPTSAPTVYENVIHNGEPQAQEKSVFVARVTAFVVGFVSIAVAILLGPTLNVAFLVALAFAVAASANLPVIVMSIFWKRFTTEGAVWGLATGLVSSLALIVISPSIMGVDGPGVAAAAHHLIQHKPVFPLENPGILSIPLGFAGAFIGTRMSRMDDNAEAKFTELEVRANTGLGSEQASAH